MPTSAPGSSRSLQRGFTLLELLVVLMIIAVSVGVVSLALRDGSATQLEREGARLSALLEMARAESRVTGTPVRWVPGSSNPSDPPEARGGFRFVGMSKLQPLPSRWLDGAVSGQVVGGDSVLLGPDALLPPQRIVLRLAEQRLELASDGLGPFAVVNAPP
jgi:general secretion pathway protein H